MDRIVELPVVSPPIFVDVPEPHVMGEHVDVSMTIPPIDMRVPRLSEAVTAGGVQIDGGELGINVDNPEYMVDVKAVSFIEAAEPLTVGVGGVVTSSGVYTGHLAGHMAGRKDDWQAN